MSGTLCRRNIVPGREVCLPLSCESTYVVQQNDTCFDVELAHYADGVRFGNIRRFNPWVNNDCSNLVSASNNAYGHVICLTPQNGFAGGDEPEDPENGDPPSWSTPGGWSSVAVPAPDGATVAPGTAEMCGVWHTALEGDSCALFSIKGPTTIDILRRVNPSLGTTCAGYDARVEPDLRYCALPHEDAVSGEVPEDPEMPVTTTTSDSETPTPTNTLPPAPTLEGIPENCNEWYLVKGNQNSLLTMFTCFSR